MIIICYNIITIILIIIIIIVILIYIINIIILVDRGHIKLATPPRTNDNIIIHKCIKSKCFNIPKHHVFLEDNVLRVKKMFITRQKMSSYLIIIYL